MTSKTHQMQALQHKLDTLQKQYDLTANKLNALGERKAVETDVSERFKLDADMRRADADLHQLGTEIDELAQKIQAIESGELKLSDVLKQEGLQTPAKSQQLLNPLFAVGAAIIIVGSVGILVNSRSNTGTNSTPQSSSQSQIELDSRFAGTWTTEGDHGTLYMMEMNITNLQSNQLSGTLTSQKRNGPTSGELSLSGNGQGDAINVTVFSHNVKSPDGDGQITQPVWQAELKLEGEKLVWRSQQGSNDYFPAVVTLSRIRSSSSGN